MNYQEDKRLTEYICLTKNNLMLSNQTSIFFVALHEICFFFLWTLGNFVSRSVGRIADISLLILVKVHQPDCVGSVNKENAVVIPKEIISTGIVDNYHVVWRRCPRSTGFWFGVNLKLLKPFSATSASAIFKHFQKTMGCKGKLCPLHCWYGAVSLCLSAVSFSRELSFLSSCCTADEQGSLSCTWTQSKCFGVAGQVSWPLSHRDLHSVNEESVGIAFSTLLEFSEKMSRN